MERRTLLKAGVAGTLGFTLSGLTMSLSRTARAANHIEINLVASAQVKTLVDNATVTVWEFVDPLNSGPGVLGSGIVMQAGQEVVINLQNDLPVPVNIVVPGLLGSTPATPTGAQRTYRFTVGDAGSYLIHDDRNGELGKAMGLSLPLVALPADGSQTLMPGAAAYDRSYTLVLSEIDTRLNDAVAAGLPFDLSTYAPNYYFVNGLSYPNTTTDAETYLDMAVGENIAIRFINAGLIYYPMHFHGYHVMVNSRNRQAEQFVVHKDTVLVKTGECVEMLLPVTQPGVYPIHTHYLPGVTANGVYANAGDPANGIPATGGGLLLMNAV